MFSLSISIGALRGIYSCITASLFVFLTTVVTMSLIIFCFGSWYGGTGNGTGTYVDHGGRVPYTTGTTVGAPIVITAVP